LFCLMNSCLFWRGKKDCPEPRPPSFDTGSR
jgi:hypothetical protein